MAFIHCLGERAGNAGADADQRNHKKNCIALRAGGLTSSPTQLSVAAHVPNPKIALALVFAKIRMPDRA